MNNRLKTEAAVAYVALPTFIGNVIGQELGIDVPKPVIAVTALIGAASIVGLVKDNQSLRFHNPLQS